MTTPSSERNVLINNIALIIMLSYIKGLTSMKRKITPKSIVLVTVGMIDLMSSEEMRKT